MISAHQKCNLAIKNFKASFLYRLKTKPLYCTGKGQTHKLDSSSRCAKTKPKRGFTGESVQ